MTIQEALRGFALLPAAVGEAERITEFIFLSSIGRGAASRDELRMRFFEELRTYDIGRALFGLRASTWSEYLNVNVRDGLVEEREGAFALTPTGKARLTMLRESTELKRELEDARRTAA